MAYKVDYCCEPVEVLYFVEYHTDGVTHRIEDYHRSRIENIFTHISKLMESIASYDFPIVSVRRGTVRYFKGEMFDEQDDADSIENYV